MDSHNKKKPFYIPAVTGFGLIIVAILAAMAGPLGNRIGWWDFETAVNIAKWAAYAGLASSILCLLGLIVTRPGGKRRGFIFSIMGLIIIAPTVLYLQSWKEAKQTLPPIQDISTNIENAPSFWYAPNTRVYGGFEDTSWQEEAYPDIKPLVLPLSANKTYDLVLKLIRKRGWRLWEPNRDDMHIEATEKTFWFGYKDDVVIHITELDGNRSQVDMRSASRYGTGGDGGTNANRIRSLFRDLKKYSQK